MLHKSRLTSKQSRKFVERRKTRDLFTLLLIMISVITWIYFLSKLSKISYFTIDNIYISGADSDISDSIKTAVLESINGDYLGLFSKANSLIFPKQDIRRSVINISPRVDTLSIDRSGFNSISILIKEKSPSAIVCAELPDISDISDISSLASSTESLNQCYFSDASGYIFKKAPDFSNQVYNRYYFPALTDVQASSTHIIGKYATSTIEFTALQKFYEELKSRNISIEGILSKDNGEYEIYAHNPKSASSSLTADNSTDFVVIYFNNERSFAEQSTNFVSFWTFMQKEASGHQRFDYIDLRYGSNVFYRMID